MHQRSASKRFSITTVESAAHGYKAAHSPLVNGDHPELDVSDLLSEDDQKVCQSFIGALQWVIQIGCFS